MTAAHMTDIAARSGAGHRAEIVALQVLVGIFLALRLVFTFNGDLLADEAYYFLWGQRLDWSYFDHAPLHAWLLRAMYQIFGWQDFTVRVLTWVTLGGVLAIFGDWSRRFAPHDPALWFWRTAAIYLASPLFFGMTMVAYNDHLLVFFTLLALHCFLLFTSKHEEGETGALPWLYGAALALGAAALSKYNGAFVGLGFALMFLIRPKLRGMLRGPHPWLAGVLALATQVPVIWWNLAHSGASFRFHLDERWGAQAWTPSAIRPLIFVGMTIIVLSPILLYPLLRTAFGKAETPFEDRARTLVLPIFVISTLTMTAVGVFLEAYFYWNIVAFAGLIPLFTRYVSNVWARGIHLLYGLVFAIAIVVNFTVAPMQLLVTGRQDPASGMNFGWPEITQHLIAAQQEHPADLIGAPRYPVAAQVGFALHRLDAISFNRELSQYLYWKAGENLEGRSGLVLIGEPDIKRYMPALKERFASLEEVDRFTIRNFGYEIYTWRIYRGEGYAP
jgi:4-amino-4-deoxy-L-arabinose transferase-like glycosyltransferase